MINKNIKKFVSGLLLSCHVMSFSGYALDVLKENDCGSSEKLKKLLCICRQLQQEYIKYNQNFGNTQSRAQQVTNVNLSGTTNPVNILDFFNYSVDDLRKIKQEIINILQEETILQSLCIPLLRTDLYNKEQILKHKNIVNFLCMMTLLKDKKYNLIAMLPLLKLKYKDKIKKIDINSYIKENIHLGLDICSDTSENPITINTNITNKADLTNFCQFACGIINYLSTYGEKIYRLGMSKISISDPDIKPLVDSGNYMDGMRSINPGKSKDLSFLGQYVGILNQAEKKSELSYGVIRNLIKQTFYNTWEEDNAKYLQDFRGEIEPYVLKFKREIGLAKSFTDVSNSKNITKSYLSHLNIKSLESVPMPILNYTKIQQKNVRILSIDNFKELSQSEIDSSYWLGDQKINVILPCPKILDNPNNFHLEEHFKENDYIVNKINETKKLTYGGKFNVPGSIFEKANNMEELLNTPMDNKIIIVATYDIEKDSKKFKNYVFYIHDYEKYGFVKTGEVYSKLDNKWHSAYALMFVTDENDDLVTVHPRYM